jgi:hypothetical protein
MSRRVWIAQWVGCIRGGLICAVIGLICRYVATGFGPDGALTLGFVSGMATMFLIALNAEKTAEKMVRIARLERAEAADTHGARPSVRSQLRDDGRSRQLRRDSR